MPTSDLPNSLFENIEKNQKSSPPALSNGLRPALFVFGIVLGLSGIWMLLAELLSPKSAGLPLDRRDAEAAGTSASSAVLAAEIGAVRGDLWAKAAFTGARLMWSDHPASPGRTSLDQLARVKANAERALAFAPINGAAWLLLAKLPDTSPDAEKRVATLLEMSYFTAPAAPELAPCRLERVATSNALADEDIQAFVKSDLREILSGPPEFRQAIVSAYRNAWPKNQPIFESLIASIDPAAVQLLGSGQAK